MRHSRLLAFILTGFLCSHCSLFDSKNSDDDDDGGDSGEGGESGESTKGGSSGSAGRPSTGGTGSSGKGGSGTGGSKGGTTSVGGSSTGGSSAGGDGNTGALGGSDPGSGGDGATGATGGTSETGGAGGTLGGSGGSGGTVGGTGGTGGGGTGGSAGGVACDDGEGLELVIEPGADTQSAWIDGGSNCVGIQGALYPSVDEVGSSLTITETDGQVCVSGTATRVLSGNFDDYWGARLVVQLNNDGTGAVGSYDAVAHGVNGFEFTLSGGTIPEELRPVLFNFGSATQYCKRVCASGPQSILLDEAIANCWEGVSTATPTGSSLERIEFLIPSNETANVPFNFCISGLTAITDNVTVGDPGTCSEPEPAGSCEGQCGLNPSCFCDVYCIDDLTGCCADFEAQCL